MATDGVCERCGGYGVILTIGKGNSYSPEDDWMECPDCHGTGQRGEKRDGE